MGAGTRGTGGLRSRVRDLGELIPAPLVRAAQPRARSPARGATRIRCARHPAPRPRPQLRIRLGLLRAIQLRRTLQPTGAPVARRVLGLAHAASVAVAEIPLLARPDHLVTPRAQSAPS